MLNFSQKHHRANKSTGTSPERDFSVIMSETTHGMPRYSRIFSQFIHSRSVSSLSTVISRTIARPNAILFGAIFSFSLTLAAYLLSKNLGYSLSGFESMGAFLLGWTVGILFDILSPFFKKKR